MTNNISFLFREKPLKILLELRENNNTYGSKISRKINCTYSHTIKLTQQIEELGIIGREKVGRKTLLKLTKKGKEITEYLNKIIKRLE